jgi:hypothetical protein
MNAQEQEPSGRHGQQTTAGASDDVSQAVVKMLLFSYGGFVDTVFRLLNCVPVCTAVRAGGLYSQTSDCTQTTSVLFYAGGEECGGWQFPIWLLLLLVFALPLFPTLLWIALYTFPSSWCASSWVQQSVKRPAFSSKTIQAAFASTTAPFR